MKQESRRKVLITGGAGFIGTNLVEFLLEKTDWQIKVLDNLSVGKLDNLKRIKGFCRTRVKFLEGDIRNREDIKRMIKNCDYVVNLAAQTGVIPSQKNPLEGVQINVIGIVHLLEESLANNVKKFVQISSGAVLGGQEVPFNEKKLPLPISPYGASKLAGEGYCSAFSGTFGIETVVLRLSNVYGPFSFHKNNAVPQFIKAIIEGGSVVINGNGKQTRDFLYVRDAAEAIFLSLTSKFQNNFELFQLGTGQENSINNLFRLVEKELNKRDYNVSKPIYKKPRQGEIRRNYADIAKARRVLGFRPKINLEKGISFTVDNYLNLFSR